MLGRTATSATWSGPFSSAIRRRASSSTSLRERADPATRDPSRLVLDPALRQQRRHDPVGQVGGRDPLQRGVRRPRRQAGPAAGHRAEPADRLDRQPLQRLLVAVAQRGRAARPEVAERLRRCRARASASSSSVLVGGRRPRRPGAGSRGRRARRTWSAATASSPAWRRTPSRTVARSVPRQRPGARRPRRGPRPATRAARPSAAPRGRRCAGRPARCRSSREPQLLRPRGRGRRRA